jgi:hypothetical protein
MNVNKREKEELIGKIYLQYSVVEELQNSSNMVNHNKGFVKDHLQSILSIFHEKLCVH